MQAVLTWHFDCRVPLFITKEQFRTSTRKTETTFHRRSPGTEYPDQTESLVLVVDDPDAPSGLFTHWLVYGMNAASRGLKEKQPYGTEVTNGGRQGLNGFGDVGYDGPQPPEGTHRYFFHLYALDTDTHLPAGMTRQEIYGAIEGHILEEATLMGRYSSHDGTPRV